MSTAFFENQDEARRNTRRLVWFFLFSVCVLIVFAYGVLILAFDLTGGDEHFKPGLWHPYLFLGAAACTVVVVGCGSLYKIAQLSSGGKAVALLLGGQEISQATRDRHEKRLLNIVEEMALASGVPVPAVFLLPEEMGINAFAAGYSPGDAVVAVSQGSLNYLNRDELQGVVAHEFSHILNGDMRLNIRLMGLIHGIIVVSLIGLYIMSVSGRSRRSNNDRSGNFFLLGLGLYILGIVGAFLGQLIQAAVSRQREFLADASAIQFTRNPEGIGGALKKIGGLELGSTISHREASEVGHMFFAQGVAKSFTQMWATHPPLKKRIRRIDPNWDGAYPEVQPLVDDRDDDKPARTKPPLTAGMPALPGMPNVPLPVVLGLSEASQSNNFAEPNEPPEQIPSRFESAIEEPFSARAVIYALLLDPELAIRDKQLAALQAKAEPKDFSETKKWESAANSLPEDVRLAIAHRAIPALRRMSPKQYEVFRAQVEQLIVADQKVSLFEFCLERVVIYHLDLAFRWRLPSRARYRAPAQLGDAIVTVLGMLAWQGVSRTRPDVDNSAARKAFMEGYQQFLPGQAVPDLPGADSIGLADFGAALDRFSQAIPAVQSKFLQSCLACITSSGVVVSRERKLLRAICSTLNCPMPELAAT